MLLASCTSNPSKTFVGYPKSMDDFYQGAGVEKFFLADLPTWANFSDIGKCRRKTSIRYINYKQLSESYGMSYEALSQMQLMLNRRYQSYIENAKTAGLRPRDEAYLFHNVFDQIEGGARELSAPNFAKVHLFWIDPIINNSKFRSKWKKFYATDRAHAGVPYWVSLCMTEKEMIELANELGVEVPVGRMISAAGFSPFSSQMVLSWGYNLDVKQLFTKPAEFVLYTIGEEKLDGLTGFDKTIQIK